MGVRWENNAGYRNPYGTDLGHGRKTPKISKKSAWRGNHGTGRYSFGVSEPNFPKQVVFLPV